MQIEPLGDRLLIEPDPVSVRSHGGIYLPDRHKLRIEARAGTVVAAGPGRRDEAGRYHPADVRPGDAVYYDSLKGDEFKVGERKCLLIRDQDVLAVLDVEDDRDRV